MATIDPAATKRPLAPPDRALVAETIHTRLPFRGTFKTLLPLAGDASNRRYFRIDVSGDAPSSVILMQLAEPEAFKQSEEAVSGVGDVSAELPFINIRTHLAKAGVPVPTLYYYDQSAGLLYLEDFGDVTLSDACAEARPAVLEARYKQAIDVLVGMQSHATSPADPECLAFHRRFDVPLLMWEFDHFLEYGITARQGRPMEHGDEAAFRE